MKEKNSVFFRKTAHIVVPSTLQSILMNSLTFVDTMMIGQLGEKALAAVGLASQVAFLSGLFFYGTSTALSIFAARAWGAQDTSQLEKITATGTALALLGSFALFLVSILIPDRIMALYTNDPEVAAMGIVYMRTLAPSFFFQSFTTAGVPGLRSTGHAGIPLAASSAAVFTDISLNWCLIFGHFGLPALGVRGAALATMLARVLEAVIITVSSYAISSPTRIRSRAAFIPDRNFLKVFFPTALPVIANEFLWALGRAVQKIAYATEGTEAMAALNIATSVQEVLNSFIYGMTSSTLIMVGQKIGSGDREGTRDYVRRFTVLSFSIGGVLGILQTLGAGGLVRLFGADGATFQQAVACMRSEALTLPVLAYSYTLVTGILRAGGDTAFTAALELSCVWAIGVPLAFLGSVLLGWPLWAVLLLVALEEVVKCMIGYRRVKSGKWLKSLS